MPLQNMQKAILEFDYCGLRKVISGGQCGVDYGALVAAKHYLITTGGSAPHGWRTQYGPMPELAEFGLFEHASPAYPPRTECNVIDADATLIIASDFNSPGVNLTRKLCIKHKKPFLEFGIRDLRTAPIVNFIIDKQVEILNVAGNRDKIKGQMFHKDSTYAILSRVFNLLEQEHKLIKLA